MADHYRVLVTDRAWPDCGLERDILDEVGGEVIEASSQDEPTLIELVRDVDAIATCWAQVTSAVIRAAPRCRVVARFGIGLDNISVETATELKIPVTYVPDYCVQEVSDHALALLLACARKVAFFNHRARRGLYELQIGPPLRRLAGQVLGLVGLGRIAQALYPKACALGLDVVAFTPSGNDYGTGCRMISFDNLLEQSDFISLHAPLSEQTRHMFGARQFQRMKPSAYLINTSRGPLIDQLELRAALDKSELAGAALDVFDPEPPDLSQPLFQDERVLITPHAGFLSQESLVELRSRTFRQIVQVFQGLQPEHVVNPSVYE